MKFAGILTILSMCLIFSYQTFAQTDTFNAQHFLTEDIYFYKLTNEQALKVANCVYNYDSFYEFMDSTYFSNPADSIKEIGIEENNVITELNPGHYLKMSIDYTGLNLELISINTFDVKMLESGNLVKINDSTGTPISDALVTLKGEKLEWDDIAKGYRFKKRPKEGVLEIAYKDETCFHFISKKYSAFEMFRFKYKGSWIRRYFIRPVTYPVRLIIDGGKSIIRGYSTGTIYSIKSAAQRWKSNRILSEIPEQNRGSSWYSHNTHAFIVTNKPMYRPGDTLFFKSAQFFMDGKAIKGSVIVSISNMDNDIEQLVIPYRAGFTEGYFVLHDSLKMTLDRDYRISVYSNAWKRLSYTHFRFEDYSLNSNRIKFKDPEKDNSFHKGETFTQSFSIQDENRLPVRNVFMDLECNISKLSLKNEGKLCIDKTLIDLEHYKLEDGTFTLNIPDSIMPDADVSINVFIRLITPDRKELDTLFTVNYYTIKSDIDYEISEGKIHIRYTENNIAVQADAYILIEDNYRKPHKAKKIALPYESKIDPSIKSINIRSNGLSESISMYQYDDNVEFRTIMPSEGIHNGLVEVENPHGLLINWYLLSKKYKVLESGTTDSALTFEQADKEKILLLEYIWAGRKKSRSVFIDKSPYTLYPSIDIPNIINPGDSVEITIKVRNYENEPVKNVDISCYSYTNKFPDKTPVISQFRNHYFGKINNSFFIDDSDKRIWLPSRIEKDLASEKFDSDEKFEFIFSEDLYSQYFLNPDSTTSFQVFLKFLSYWESPSMIELDGRPIFSAYSNDYKPYKFECSPGIHHLKVYYRNKIFTIEEFETKQYCNKLVSINIYSRDSIPVKEEIEDNRSKIQDMLYEKHHIQIFPSEETRFILIDGQLINPLKSRNYFIGPLLGHERVTVINEDSTTFSFIVKPGNKYILSEDFYELEDIRYYSYPDDKDPVNFLDIPFDSRAIIDDYFKYIRLDKELESWISESSTQDESRLNIDLRNNNEVCLLFCFSTDSIEGLKVKKLYSTSETKYLPEGNWDLYFYFHDKKLVKKNINITSGKYSYLLLEKVNELPPALYDELIARISRVTTQPKEKITKSLEDFSHLIIKQNGARYYYYGRTEEMYDKLTEYYEFKSSPERYSSEIIGQVWDNSSSTYKYYKRDLKDFTAANGKYRVDVQKFKYSRNMKWDYTYEPVFMAQYLHSMPGRLAAGTVVRSYAMRSAAYYNDTRSESPAAIEESHSEPIEFPAGQKVRSNFEDVAFWEPRLTTDENGEVSFKIKFPDDITSWKIHVVAVNNKKQSGYTSTTVNAIKEKVVRLNLPKHLINGDSININGYVQNYAGDTSTIFRQFEIDNIVHNFGPGTLINTISDSISVTNSPENDSLNISYFISDEHSIIDGEKRSIEILPQGIYLHIGEVYRIVDSASIPKPDSASEYLIFATMTPDEIFWQEAEKLANYPYDCNEQLASRLIALTVLNQSGTQSWWQKRRNKKEIEKIAETLSKRMNYDFLWGWHRKGETSIWVSTHVTRAVAFARNSDEDYFSNISDVYWNAENSLFRAIKKSHSGELIDLMSGLEYYHAMHRLMEDLREDSGKVISDPLRKFRYIHLQQLAYGKIDISEIWKYKSESALGNICFVGYDSNNDLIANNTLLTLQAYKILKENGTADDTLRQIRNWLLEIRTKNGWGNTYINSIVLMTVYEELESNGQAETSFTLSGPVNGTYNEAYKGTINFNKDLQVDVKNDGILYLSVTQKLLDPTPKYDSSLFVIKTSFSDTVSKLKPGDIVSMNAELTVLKEINYVVMEIPIPAGFAYKGKSQFPGEAHREYYRDKVVIYFEKLKPGTMNLEIDLLLQYSGSFTLNPAKAESMYFPSLKGNNCTTRVRTQ